MKRFKQFITLQEASYPNNLGFQELVQYYQIATDEQIEEIEEYIKAEDWEGFKSQIHSVLGVELQ